MEIIRSILYSVAKLKLQYVAAAGATVTTPGAVTNTSPSWSPGPMPGLTVKLGPRTPETWPPCRTRTPTSSCPLWLRRPSGSGDIRRMLGTEPGAGVTARPGGSSPGVPENPTTSVDTPRTTWLPTSAPREAGTISPWALIPRSTLDLFVNMKIKHCNCKKKRRSWKSLWHEWIFCLQLKCKCMQDARHHCEGRRLRIIIR